jgi:hypothetical protein
MIEGSNFFTTETFINTGLSIFLGKSFLITLISYSF